MHGQRFELDAQRVEKGKCAPVNQGASYCSLQLFTNRYKGGVDTYLQVINAQTIARANERNNVDILRRRMDASVLLSKALGGGLERFPRKPASGN
jgi:hypothetical protein